MHFKQAGAQETGPPLWALACWDCHNDGVRIPCAYCISVVSEESVLFPPSVPL